MPNKKGIMEDEAGPWEIHFSLILHFIPCFYFFLYFYLFAIIIWKCVCSFSLIVSGWWCSKCNMGLPGIYMGIYIFLDTQRFGTRYPLFFFTNFWGKHKIFVVWVWLSEVVSLSQIDFFLILCLSVSSVIRLFIRAAGCEIGMSQYWTHSIFKFIRQTDGISYLLFS